MKAMTVKTVPVAKGRPRFYGRHAVTPERTRAYEGLLRRSWQHGIVQGDALYVVMLFTLPIPASLSKRRQAELVGAEHVKKPDLDNLVKAVLDALNGVAYEDDSKICYINASKVYGEEPSVTVRILDGSAERAEDEQ